METEGESRLSELDSDQTRQRITAKATETKTEKKKTSVVLPRAHDGALARIDAMRIEEEQKKRESRRDVREYTTSATNFTVILAGALTAAHIHGDASILVGDSADM